MSTNCAYARATAVPKVPEASPNILLRVLLWLSERDRHYRSMRKLERMPSERLKDMGLTRPQADPAFRHGGGNRAAGREPLEPRGGAW